MGKPGCTEKMAVKKGPWSPEEDQKLVAYIQQHGHGNWRTLPAKAGLQRCGKSCRLRWSNYLRPDIKRGAFSLQEDQTIIQLHAFLGNRWSRIATHLPKRTDNEIKNYWNSHLKKRLIRMGIDPITHRRADTGYGRSKGVTSNLSHMAQWENVRLQAEARPASKLESTSPQPLAQLILDRIPAGPLFPPCLDVLRAWQSSSPNPINHKSDNIMHSIYAMVLTAKANDFESPMSTLNFAGSKLPVSTTIGQHSDNFLASSVCTSAVATSSSATSTFGINIETMDNSLSSWEDDGVISASMEEAFIAARYENVPAVLRNNVKGEGGRGNMVNMYDSNEISTDGNLEMISKNGYNYNLNSEGNNIHSKDSTLGMVNGLECAWPTWF